MREKYLVRKGEFVCGIRFKDKRRTRQGELLIGGRRGKFERMKEIASEMFGVFIVDEYVWNWSAGRVSGTFIIPVGDWIKGLGSLEAEGYSLESVTAFRRLMR